MGAARYRGFFQKKLLVRKPSLEHRLGGGFVTNSSRASSRPITPMCRGTRNTPLR